MDARERQDTVPFDKILDEARQQQEGDVIDAALVQSGDRLIYRVRVLNDVGEIHDLFFDAQTGASVSGS